MAAHAEDINLSTSEMPLAVLHAICEQLGKSSPDVGAACRRLPPQQERLQQCCM